MICCCCHTCLAGLQSAVQGCPSMHSFRILHPLLSGERPLPAPLHPLLCASPLLTTATNKGFRAGFHPNITRDPAHRHCSACWTGSHMRAGRARRRSIIQACMCWISLGYAQSRDEYFTCNHLCSNSRHPSATRSATNLAKRTAAIWSSSPVRC